ncbi:hypothetical protein P1838_04430 [Salmonella enterica subsp. enterica]|uniref:hypothetical protein n=1 Tax=Salmonella enterica TaxID=28901 RepID=UPI002417567A|nr:hypothetical protein [Salmonella enterica]WFQ05399.1 hypothetical protein P1838_04430 [Salmonella enterica subsp. enterica]
MTMRLSVRWKKDRRLQFRLALFTGGRSGKVINQLPTITTNQNNSLKKDALNVMFFIIFPLSESTADTGTNTGRLHAANFTSPSAPPHPQDEAVRVKR